MRCYGDGTARNAAAVEPVFTGPAELDIRLQSSYSGIEPPVLVRMILLPLQSASGMIDRAIGAFVTKGPLNHAPYRFEIERTDLHPLDKETAAVTPPLNIDMQPTKVPYLRVLSGARAG
jgi:hypothetical protein